MLPEISKIFLSGHVPNVVKTLIDYYLCMIDNKNKSDEQIKTNVNNFLQYYTNNLNDIGNSLRAYAVNILDKSEKTKKFRKINNLCKSLICFPNYPELSFDLLNNENIVRRLYGNRIPLLQYDQRYVSYQQPLENLQSQLEDMSYSNLYAHILDRLEDIIETSTALAQIKGNLSKAILTIKSILESQESDEKIIDKIINSIKTQPDTFSKVKI